MNQTDTETVGRTEWDIVHLLLNGKYKLLFAFALGVFVYWYFTKDNRNTQNEAKTIGKNIEGNYTENNYYNPQQSEEKPKKNSAKPEVKPLNDNKDDKIQEFNKVVGIVIDKNLDSVVNAKVVVTGSGIVEIAYTNENGKFTFKIPKGIYNVKYTFSKEGFETSFREISVNPNIVELKFND